MNCIIASSREISYSSSQKSKQVSNYSLTQLTVYTHYLYWTQRETKEEEEKDD